MDHLETLDSPNDNLRTQSKELLKSLYDYTCAVQPSKFAPKGAVSELHVDGFSDGQIWEQMRGGIEHLAVIATKKQQEWLAKSLTILTPPQIPQEASEEEFDDEDDFDEDGYDDFDEDFEDEDDEEDEEYPSPNNRKTSLAKTTAATKQPAQPTKPLANSAASKTQQAAGTKSTKRKRKHVLDDGFFDHDDYERFANQGENYGTEDYDGEEIDLFDPRIFQKSGDGSDDDEAFATYKDFFGDYVPPEFEDEEDNQDGLDGMDFDQDIFGNGDAEGEGFDDFDMFGGEGETGMDDFDAMFGGDFGGEGEEGMDDFDAMFGESAGMGQKRSRNFYDDDEDDDTLMDLNNNDDDNLAHGGSRQKNAQTLQDVNSFMKIDDDEQVMDHLLSPYDERRKKLADQIDALEREISGPKAWDMRGATSGYQRHKDELIGHDIDFVQGMKATRPITADVARQFDQIIIARIRDNAFDDVQPRALNKGDDNIYAKLAEKDQNELSTAKPRFGLAEQYEKDFKQLAQGFAEENVELQKKYSDIAHSYAILSNQLDALCNYFYTAKVSVKELSVTDSASVINKTEIAPVATAHATINQGSLLTTTTSAAPQELHTAKADGLGASRGEMSQAEKDAALRRRKQQRKQHRQHEEDNLHQKAKLGDKGAQKKVEKDQLAKDYAKVTKSGQVTVHATAQKGGKKGPSHNYTTMAGVLDAVKHNEQQAKQRKNPTKGQAQHAKNIMQ